MKKCEKCGKEFDDVAQFCNICGSNLIQQQIQPENNQAPSADISVQEAVPAQYQESPIPNTPPQPNPPVTPQNTWQPDIPQKNSNKTALLLIIIIVLLIVVLGLVGWIIFSPKGNNTDNNNETISTVTETPSPSPAATASSAVSSPSSELKLTGGAGTPIKDGQYKVGSDILPGEYIAIKTAGASYASVNVSKDSTGSSDSMIAYINVDSRSYVSISDGQYITLKNIELYALADAPKPDDSLTVLPAGMYKVGADIQPGEYIITKNANESYASISVSTDATGSFDSIIKSDSVDARYYITVSDGQYITLYNSSLYISAADAPPVDASNGFIPSGMYKVGTDLQPGEYVVVKNADESYASYTVLKNSNANANYNNYVTSDSVESRSYVTVSDGQYLELYNASLQLN